MEKITYASLSSLGDAFHQDFENAVAHVTPKLGRSHPLYINGRKRITKEAPFHDFCPANAQKILGTFQAGGREEARLAIRAARAAFPEWRDLGWPQRVSFLRKAAELMTERQYRFAALLSLEVGKNRFEAISEVSESIDLILYYCQQMEEHEGYEQAMGGSGGERTKSVLKPYGVWAVVSPFNFPLALATGMAAGALVGGNTVVFKPASDAPLAGLCLYETLHDAGLPVGVFNFVTGSGQAVGEELLVHPEVDGFVFTGSKKVGLHILKHFSKNQPRPCLVEMGGKNAAIVMSSAHLEDAAEGVLRSAFGMGGQKCSACSRVYLHKDIARAFLDLLVEKTRGRKIGNPLDRDTFLGPLINEQAVKTYERAIQLGRREGRLLHGGQRLMDEPLEKGFYVEPAIIDRLPKNSALFQEEFFVPLLAVAEVKTLAEAIALANQSEYGLTAGIFTESESEQDLFFANIQAGVTYCNRAGGATTGAWPGVQSFGGWKGSGSSGKSALGPYYVPQFMREQSQTVVKKIIRTAPPRARGGRDLADGP